MTGKTYHNRGKGTTRRKVLEISDAVRPYHFHSMNEPPDEPGVLYKQCGLTYRLYLSSFAKWAGGVCD